MAEIIDSAELGRRLGLPESWVREHVRQRVADRIPCLRFGKYVRFDWHSDELRKWIAVHSEQVGAGTGHEEGGNVQ